MHLLPWSQLPKQEKYQLYKLPRQLITCTYIPPVQLATIQTNGQKKVIKSIISNLSIYFINLFQMGHSAVIYISKIARDTLPIVFTTIPTTGHWQHDSVNLQSKPIAAWMKSAQTRIELSCKQITMQNRTIVRRWIIHSIKHDRKWVGDLMI